MNRRTINEDQLAVVRLESALRAAEEELAAQLETQLRQRNESIRKLNAHLGWNATNACSGEDGCWCDAHRGDA